MIHVCEVGPRDGLQNEAVVFPAQIRAELINRLGCTGISLIEAVSFVSPRVVPQMAESERVLTSCLQRKDVRYAGLILNERGYDRLLASGLREAHFAFACTEKFNRLNQNASVDESMETAARIITRGLKDGIRVSVALAVAFGCPYEGPVDPSRVLDLAGNIAEFGAERITFADTIGVAVPSQVRSLISRATAFINKPIGMHFHNTRNTGIANSFVAMEAGAVVLESSIGGIGGCPFAPRATGNIATEDLVYLLDHEGVKSGIDIDELIKVSYWLEKKLGRRLPGYLSKAGPFPLPAGAHPGSVRAE